MKTAMKRATRDETGKVLILTLILLVVGGLIMTPLLGLMSTGLTAGRVYERKMAELYAADAGVESAVWRILNGIIEAPTGCNPDDEWKYDISGAINAETVSVLIEYVGEEMFRVTSTAGGDSKPGTQVESYVFYGSQWGDILDYGVVALDGNISIRGTSMLDSFPQAGRTHIYAHGNIEIEGSAGVHGAATATGTIEAKEGAIDPGPTNPDLNPPLEFRLPDLSVYLAEANRGQFIDGNLPIPSSRTLGPARVTGNLHVTSDATLTLAGTVWVDGTITTDAKTSVVGEGPLVAGGNVVVQGSAAPSVDQMPVIISTSGTIRAAGGSESYMVLYAPAGLIEVHGSGDINGAVIGKEVDISVSRGVEVVYDEEVVARVRAKKLNIMTWEVNPQE